MDLNHEKHRKVDELLKKEQGTITVEMKKVVEIGDDEKKILVRRHSRGNGGGGRRNDY